MSDDLDRLEELADDAIEAWKRHSFIIPTTMIKFQEAATPPVVRALVQQVWDAEAEWDAATGGDYHEGLEDGIKIGLAERDAALAREAKLAEARHAVESTHHFHGDSCLCGFSSARSRSRTEHITGAMFEALDADGKEANE